MLIDDSVWAGVQALPLDQLGRSVENRPLLGRVLGGDADGGAPRLLIVGGVHGDEPSSVEAVVALARRLLAGAVPSSRLLVVPALNPDGLVRGSKNSARDVDLNRNFAAANFEVAHAPGYDPGPAPLSEPETRLVAELVQRHDFRGVIAVHAPFACVNYDGPAEAWARDVGAACGWPARGDIGYPTPGSLGSWLGVDRGLPVLTIELPPGPHAAFSRQAAAALDEAIRPREWL